MKNIISFLKSWVIWAVLAIIETDDAGGYCQEMSIVFVSLGIIGLISPFLAVLALGWSWFIPLVAMATYLMIGIGYNEWMRSNFGHRIFP